MFSGKEFANFNLVIESLELIAGSVDIFESAPKILDFLITGIFVFHPSICSFGKDLLSTWICS